MARTVLAVFDSKFVADKAVDDLRQNGLSSDMVEIFARSARERGAGAGELKRKKIKNEIFTDELGTGFRIGAGVGGGVGVAGGLLVISGEIVLPFLTAMLASGPLAVVGVALGVIGLGMLTGTLTGGLFGSLLGLGISETELHQYARSVREDQVVVAVMADWDAVDPVLQVLERYAPLELEEKPYSRLKDGPVGKSSNAPHVQSTTREHEEHQ